MNELAEKYMNLNELRDKAYQCAIAHGFHEEEYSDDHLLCLVISELMEAVEADRKGNKPAIEQFNCGVSYPKNNFKQVYDCCIKGTVAEELADACIRLLDLAGLRDINIDTSAFTNVISNIRTLTENIYIIIHELMNFELLLDEQVNSAITQIFGLADMLGIDLLWHIEQKMKYNEMRENKHGKRY